MHRAPVHYVEVCLWCTGRTTFSSPYCSPDGGVHSPPPDSPLTVCPYRESTPPPPPPPPQPPLSALDAIQLVRSRREIYLYCIVPFLITRHSKAALDAII